ncbi:MAG: antibiotic biosynthesis monooxygenase [Treponema sp.]|nr:antibiotic biosynthesis monooxygenase [Treponema sp.]
MQDKCLFMQVRYYLKKGTRSEFYRRFRDNNIREFSASEEGNLAYEIYFPLDSDDDICILEKWKNSDSQENHVQTLHYAILSELKAKYVDKVEIKQGWLEEY